MKKSKKEKTNASCIGSKRHGFCIKRILRFGIDDPSAKECILIIILFVIFLKKLLGGRKRRRQSIFILTESFKDLKRIQSLDPIFTAF